MLAIMGHVSRTILESLRAENAELSEMVDDSQGQLDNIGEILRTDDDGEEDEDDAEEDHDLD